MKALIEGRLKIEGHQVVAWVGLLVAAPILAYAAVSAPKLAALGTFVILFELALLYRPHLGLYLIVGCQAFDMIYVPAGFAALGLGDFAAFAVLPVWVLHRLINPRGLRLPRGWQWICLFIMLTGISMVLGVKPSIAHGPYSRAVVYVLALFAMVDLGQRERMMTPICWIMFGAGVIHAAIALAWGSATHRVGGLADQPNLLGALLAMSVIPSVGLLLRPYKTVIKAGVGFGLILMLGAIIFTVSRGTYISLGVALLWWLARYRKAIILALIVGGALTQLVSRYQADQADYITARFQMQDSSVRNRWQVALNALQVVAARPFFGVGFAQFVEVDRALDVRREAGRGAHNFYLSVAASTGLPALLCLLIFVGFQVRRLSKAKRKALAASGPDAEYNAWMVHMLQALMLYHGVSLVVRGGTRITEWTLLALYCCGAALAEKSYGASIGSSGGGAPSSSSGGMSSGSVPSGSVPSAPRKSSS